MEAFSFTISLAHIKVILHIDTYCELVEIFTNLSHVITTVHPMLTGDLIFKPIFTMYKPRYKAFVLNQGNIKYQSYSSDFTVFS